MDSIYSMKVILHDSDREAEALAQDSVARKRPMIFHSLPLYHMDNSPTPNDQSDVKRKYLEKLYMQQFNELRKLKRDRKLSADEKIKVKRQIIIKYKALRRRAEGMDASNSE